MTIRQLAESKFTTGQAVDDVTGYVAKVTNAGMFSIQDEQGKGRKVTVFLPKDHGLPPEVQPGMAIAVHGLTFKEVYNGSGPAGPYTQNQFNAASVSNPARQTPSTPGPAGHSSPAPAGNGEKDARIERQSARRDAVSLVAGMLANDLSKPASEEAVLDTVGRVYAWMLKLTGTEALPAKPAADVGGQPGKAAGQAEQPGIFTDALAARSILLRICENDTARAKAAFFNLTGFLLIADCKDAAMAQGWLTACQNIDAMYQKCAAVNRPAFVKKLAEPGLAPEIRDSELQRLAGEPDPEAIVF